MRENISAAFVFFPKDSEKSLQEHMEECEVNVPQKIVLPDEKIAFFGSIIFTNSKKSHL